MPSVTLPFWETIIRLLVAAACGGIVGIERGRKHRPAGFRTHMIVCIGAALTMVLSTYLTAMTTNVWNLNLTTDVSRFGAQVINGIGFLGAGTIIITGHQQIKGLTTAAGLWASACMGLAIGAGFYMGALVGCGLIIITIVLFTRIESFILSHSRNINLFIEFEDTEDISAIIEKIRGKDVRIFDVEITKGKYTESKYPNAIFSLRLPKKLSHSALVTEIASVDAVRMIEEL
jgi:putative Mg2+ transporter-C (MgtC) family protein